MTDDQEVADDLPDLTHVPLDRLLMIASLPAEANFPADMSGVRFEFVHGRWYVFQSGQPAQPISLRLRPPRPARSRATRSASAA